MSSDDVFAGIAAAKTQRAPVDSAPLKTPPKWFRRPCGASFAVSYIYIEYIILYKTSDLTLFDNIYLRYTYMYVGSYNEFVGGGGGGGLHV